MIMSNYLPLTSPFSLRSHRAPEKDAKPHPIPGFFSPPRVEFFFTPDSHIWDANPPEGDTPQS